MDELQQTEIKRVVLQREETKESKINVLATLVDSMINLWWAQSLSIKPILDAYSMRLRRQLMSK